MIALVVSRSDIMRCPLHALSASHYLIRNGKVTCKCKASAQPKENTKP